MTALQKEFKISDRRDGQCSIKYKMLKQDQFLREIIMGNYKETNFRKFTFEFSFIGIWVLSLLDFNILPALSKYKLPSLPDWNSLKPILFN